MPYSPREQSVLRQFALIRRLYRMESLRASEISPVYNASTKTITRDFQKITKVIPLINRRGVWSLDHSSLEGSGRSLSSTVLYAFAQNAGLDLICFDRESLSQERVDFAIAYGSLPKTLGTQILEALEQERQCRFRYQKSDGSSQRHCDPIKLYTENGRWYLIAKDYRDDRIKTFLLSRISTFHTLQDAVTLTPAMLEEAEAIYSVWKSGRDASPVRLYIQPEAARYIRETPLHKTQKILDEHHDGCIETGYLITHKLEILPQIKSWIPHISILEPRWLRDELHSDMKKYQETEIHMDI